FSSDWSSDVCSSDLAGVQIDEGTDCPFGNFTPTPAYAFIFQSTVSRVLHGHILVVKNLGFPKNQDVKITLRIYIINCWKVYPRSSEERRVGKELDS